MLLSKPLTVGLVLVALSAVSQGRVIQPSKDDELYTPIRAETLASTGSDFCRFHPEWVDCTKGSAFDIGDSYHSKRAPPKLSRPGKGDDPSGQDGSGEQTGEGSQTGGDKNDGEAPDAPPPDAPPPIAIPPVDAPVVPGPPPVLAAYADIPTDFNVPGRQLGVDVLPKEVPNFRGLSDSPEDAAMRASWERFNNWDAQSSNLVGPDRHFLLYLGNSASDSRTDFRNQFNLERKHTDDLPPEDQGHIVDNIDIYAGIKSGDDKVPIPPQFGGDTLGLWLSMLQSYGVAKRAAQRGGTVRVLVETKPAVVSRGLGAPDTTVAINKDKLFQEGSYFYNFELGVVTGDGTNVKSVRAYGATKIKERFLDPTPENDLRMSEREFWEFTDSEEIWKTGEASLGKKPDFIAGTLPENERPRPEGDDGLIDLGDFR